MNKVTNLYMKVFITKKQVKHFTSKTSKNLSYIIFLLFYQQNTKRNNKTFSGKFLLLNSKL